MDLIVDFLLFEKNGAATISTETSMRYTAFSHSQLFILVGCLFLIMKCCMIIQ